MTCVEMFEAEVMEMLRDGLSIAASRQKAEQNSHDW